MVKGEPEANSVPSGLLNVKVSVDDPEVNLRDPKVVPPGLKIWKLDNLTGELNSKVKPFRLALVAAAY